MYEIEGMYINKLRNMNSFSSHSNASSTAERFDTQSTDFSNPTYQSRPPSSLSSYCCEPLNNIILYYIILCSHINSIRIVCWSTARRQESAD